MVSNCASFNSEVIDISFDMRLHGAIICLFYIHRDVNGCKR
jgi:hypothetical protein